MNKYFSLILLLSTSLSADTPTTPDDLLREAKETIEESNEVKGNGTKGNQQSTGDLLRSLGEWFDTVEEVAEQSWKVAGEQVHKALKTTEKHIKGGSKRSVNYWMEDEPNRAIVKIQMSGFLVTPEKDLKLEVEKDRNGNGGSFHMHFDAAETPEQYNIVGTTRNGMLTLEITARTVRTSKDGTSNTVTASNSVIQRSITGDLNLDTLQVTFSKEEELLTITIDKQNIPERDVRTIPVIVT